MARCSIECGYCGVCGGWDRDDREDDIACEYCGDPACTGECDAYFASLVDDAADAAYDAEIDAECDADEFEAFS